MWFRVYKVTNKTTKKEIQSFYGNIDQLHFDPE